MKYVPILLMVVTGGCVSANGVAQEAMATPSASSGGAAEKLCDGETDLPPDFAFSENDFSLESATRSMNFLTERINPIVSELNRSDDAGAVVRSNWEFLYIGRPNALNKINGYLLKRNAETAAPAIRAAAQAEFCAFLAATAITD